MSNIHACVNVVSTLCQRCVTFVLTNVCYMVYVCVALNIYMPTTSNTNALFDVIDAGTCSTIHPPMKSTKRMSLRNKLTFCSTDDAVAPAVVKSKEEHASTGAVVASLKDGVIFCGPGCTSS